MTGRIVEHRSGTQAPDGDGWYGRFADDGREVGPFGTPGRAVARAGRQGRGHTEGTGIAMAPSSHASADVPTARIGTIAFRTRLPALVATQAIEENCWRHLTGKARRDLLVATCATYNLTLAPGTLSDMLYALNVHFGVLPHAGPDDPPPDLVRATARELIDAPHHGGDEPLDSREAREIISAQAYRNALDDFDFGVRPIVRGGAIYVASASIADREYRVNGSRCGCPARGTCRHIALVALIDSTRIKWLLIRDTLNLTVSQAAPTLPRH